MEKNISSTEFQNQAGRYIDLSAKGPIFITKYKRPVRVLLDIEEYERLKKYDTRESLYPHELSGELKEELEKGYLGDRNPELDHLME
jgi:prevent-host-death family protein